MLLVEQLWRSLPAKTWTLERVLDSRHAALPSGRVTGQASFTREDQDGELRYEEKGVFHLNTGASFDVRKTYIWRHEGSSLAVHFDEPGQKLFHGLVFDKSSAVEDGTVTANCAPHPCAEDVYDSRYVFELKDRELVSFTVTHQVSGPQKDYTSRASYTRAVGG